MSLPHLSPSHRRGPGKHRVVFTFRSRLLQWGLLISGPAWLTVILFRGWSIRRGKT